MVWFWVLILTGCTESLSGNGTIHSNPDAPFMLDHAQTFLWRAEPTNDGLSGHGLLLVSTVPATCQDMVPYWDWDDLAADGSGLLFHPSYWTGREEGTPQPAWDGLYSSGGGVEVDAPGERGLEAAAFDDAVLYGLTNTGEGTAWLRVDDGANNRFLGGFSTLYWSGTFDARVCTPPQSAADTGD